MTWVTEAMGIIVDMVQTLLAGLGSGMVGFATDLLLTETGGLNVIGALVFVGLGISIALGAVAWVATLIRNHR